MKLAWLVWRYEDDAPSIRFEEPEEYLWVKIVPIVYTEIQK